jgi:cell division protein FtsB
MAPSRAKPSAPGGPAARRPGHATRLQAEAARAADAERLRKDAARHRSHIGFRVAILAVIVGVLFVVIFSPLRMYLAQRQELEAARAQATQARTVTEELDAELVRWNDPAYVQAQARERLGFVMPGDIAFKVVDAENAPIIEEEIKPRDAVTVVTGDIPTDQIEQDPWYTTLVQSILIAGALP